jgi:uncharacterized protein YacL
MVRLLLLLLFPFAFLAVGGTSLDRQVTGLERFPVADRNGAVALGRSRLDLVIIRLVFVIVIALACYVLKPFGLQAMPAAGLGMAIGAAVILFEMRLRNASLKRLIGAVIGSITGIFGAYLFSLVIRNSIGPGPTQSFLQLFVMMVMAYVGLVIGAGKGDLLNLAALGGLFGGEKQTRKSFKILDTSVIIDGRIADIAETGFLDGTIVIPQFVLRELQLVADSADSLKRNRGRRGLDILQRVQKLTSLHVQIVEDDFPAVREVDLKLIELAKLYEGKIVTNDFNLNKVAQLQGVDVLNINELANSLKPIVLPGELMRVFILKEGKEYNQGVAYLDDGTMVVVDNARKVIGKTIEISVTSVLQTTAGKMIFGKFDERAAPAPRPGTETRPERQDLRKNNPQPSFPATNGTANPPSSPGIPAASSSGTGGTGSE